MQTTEVYFLEAMVQHLTGPDDLSPAYRASAGLCLPHFRLALARVPDEAVFTALIEVQKAVRQRLSAELSEFIRKKDHRFQHKSFDPEGNAWLRGIEAVSGAPASKSTGERPNEM